MTDTERAPPTQRRHAPETGDRYRSLIESLPWAFFAVDAEGLLTDVNGAAVRLVERPRDELVGLRFDEMVVEDDLERAEKLFVAVMAGEVRREEADFGVVRPDGTQRTIHVAFEALQREGVVTGAHGLFRDVTDEREAATRLRASEERLRVLLGSLPGSVWTVDPEMRITTIGGSFETEQLVGRPLVEVLGSGAAADPAVEAHRRALEGESTTYAYEGRGVSWECRVEPRVEGGRIVGAVGVAMDVTEKAAAEREVERQRAQLRALFEAAPEAIVLVDPEGRVVDSNAEFERLFGWPAGEVRGRRIEGLLVPEDRVGESRTFMESLWRGERVEGEAIRRRRDGSLLQVSILARPFSYEGGRHILVVYRDVTADRILEEQLLQSQRMEALGHLAGGVAHDFNNVLTSIIGHAREVEEVVSDEAARDDLREIRSSAERAATLVRQLLAFSRRGPAAPRPVDLGALVREHLDILRRTLGGDIRLEAEVEGSLPTVSVDPVQMEQVIVNLLLNARDAMPGGGAVRIVVRKAATDAGAEGLPNVLLEVVDEGRGMQQEERARMFEPFYTTKERADATGLGLSTVYGIVEQSGGSVEVETAPGRGTTVRVVLPALEVDDAAPDVETAASPAPAPPAAADAGSVPDGTVVLLVDDDRPVREVTRRILERQGYTVFTAASGRAALDLVETLEHPPDLLLADVVMPGMSGVELADAVVELHPGTRVLFMSGYTESELRTAGEGEPPGLIPKPFDPSTLLRRVRETVGSR